MRVGVHAAAVLPHHLSHTACALARRAGLAPHLAPHLLLALLWASQANSIPSLFWTAAMVSLPGNRGHVQVRGLEGARPTACTRVLAAPWPSLLEDRKHTVVGKLWPHPLAAHARVPLLWTLHTHTALRCPPCMRFAGCCRRCSRVCSRLLVLLSPHPHARLQAIRQELLQTQCLLTDADAATHTHACRPSGRSSCRSWEAAGTSGLCPSASLPLLRTGLPRAGGASLGLPCGPPGRRFDNPVLLTW